MQLSLLFRKYHNNHLVLLVYWSKESNNTHKQNETPSHSAIEVLVSGVYLIVGTKVISPPQKVYLGAGENWIFSVTRTIRTMNLPCALDESFVASVGIVRCLPFENHRAPLTLNPPPKRPQSTWQAGPLRSPHCNTRHAVGTNPLFFSVTLVTGLCRTIKFNSPNPKFHTFSAILTCNSIDCSPSPPYDFPT